MIRMEGISSWCCVGRSLSGVESEFPGGFRDSTGESIVVDDVVKGMFAVTFEISVKLFQSTLGVVIIRGKNGGGSKPMHATL